MLRTIVFYPCIILSLIWANIIYRIKIRFLDKKEDKSEKEAYIYKVTSSWARFILKIAGAKVTVKVKKIFQKMILYYLYLTIKAF